MEFPKYSERDIIRYRENKWWLDLTMGDILDHIAQKLPEKEALVDDRSRLTFSDLKDKVDRLATGLLNLGLKKGDTVLLQLPNWAEFVYCFFALQRIGSIPVLLISGYKKLEVGHLGILTEASAWIVPESYRNIDYLSFIDDVKNKNPQLRYIISVRSKKGEEKFTTSLESLMVKRLTEDDIKILYSKRPDPTDVSHILPSGGTTGLPKGIPRTHNDYICNVKYLHQVGDMNKDDICLLAVPVGHNLALLNVVGSILIGYKLVLLDSTRPADICNTIQKEKITYMPTVPSLIKRIIELENIDSYDFSSLVKISAGGEPSPPELVKRVKERFGWRYINEFGMSEGLLCRTRFDDDIETVCYTVGKPCSPYDEIKIIDEEGRQLSVNTDGELATKGPGIFAGYLKNPEENKRAFTKDGFFRTGDLARIDHSGNLRITGRIKDIIIRGGENISPSQVEEILCSHPFISDAAVIGMPDEELGERVCAYIKTLNRKSINPEDIKSFMESKGASKLLIPERFEFVDSLPMTEAGKHDKKALREDIRKKIGKK